MLEQVPEQVHEQVPEQLPEKLGADKTLDKKQILSCSGAPSKFLDHRLCPVLVSHAAVLL